MRITLESPKPVSWRGGIKLSGGRLAKLQPLNLNAHAAAGSSLVSGQMRLHHRQPIARDAFDITAYAVPGEQLTFDLHELGKAAIAIDEARDTPQDATVGDSRVSLRVARLASDRLRIETSRSSMVFSPGEEFAFDVLADPEGVTRGRPWEFHATLERGRGGAEVWRGETRRVEGDSRGPSRQPVRIALPTTEGVYTVRLTAVEPTGFLSKFPTTRSTRPPLAQRTFQIVVVDRSRRPAALGSWRETYSHDPRKPSKWTERTPSWMHLRSLPWSDDRPLSSDGTVGQLGSSALQIAPRGDADACHWRAYPLPIEEPGSTYAVEVELLGEPGDSLTLAVLEPDALGDLRAVSGAVTHTISRWNRDQGPAKARLVVRPRTNSPLLVLANPSVDRPAVFGGFRVLRAVPKSKALEDQERIVALDWAGSDLPHLLGASHAAAPDGRYEHADMMTFVETASALADRVELAGANAAVIGVNELGASIYPSLLWRAPRYDLGVWTDGSADLPRRELLRLIAIEFRRRGLKLIPAVRFDAPTPTIEREAELADYRVGSAAIQSAQSEAIREILDAINDRDLVAGVAVRTTQGGWGLLDPVERTTQGEVDRLVESYSAVVPNWISADGGELPLILFPGGLAESSYAARALRPRLGASDAAADELLSATGLKALSASRHVQVAAPHSGRLGLPNEPSNARHARLASIRESLGNDQTPAVAAFRSSRHSVRLIRSAELLGCKSGIDVLLPAWVAEPASQAELIAQAATSPTWLVVLDGATPAGWLGERSAIRTTDFIRLPMAPGRLEGGSGDVVAAVLDQAQEGAAVAVSNRSSWPRRGRLTLEVSQRVRGQIGESAEWFNPGQHAIELALEPFETRLWRFDQSVVRVAGLRLEPNPEAQRDLAEAVADLQSRDTTARRPFGPLPNESFEQLSQEGSVVDWEASDGVRVETVDPFDGERCVTLTADPSRPVILSSRPFAMPTTGQLAIEMRVKPGEIDPAAELRIEVIQVDGEYRNSTRLTGKQLGASGSGEEPSGWLPPIVFPIDDLPLASDGRLRLRFTLTGMGSLSLDDLQAEDLILPLDGFGSIELRREKFALVRLLSASQSLLDEGRLEACRELLDSYWARFLVKNFPPHRVEESVVSDEPESPEPAPQTEETPSLSKRLRGYLPRWWR